MENYYIPANLTKWRSLFTYQTHVYTFSENDEVIYSHGVKLSAIQIKLEIKIKRCYSFRACCRLKNAKLMSQF